mmetsp:Transcript_28778/g.61147  ORF Transcript_28778/g.61147 Transcript_28778/m.61147 type:complete len:274 (+) Transcript_28778:942-1763(+)
MCRLRHNSTHALAHTATAERTATAPTAPVVQLAMLGARCLTASPHQLQRGARCATLGVHDYATVETLYAGAPTRDGALLLCPIRNLAILNEGLAGTFHKSHLRTDLQKAADLGLDVVDVLVAGLHRLPVVSIEANTLKLLEPGGLLGLALALARRSEVRLLRLVARLKALELGVKGALRSGAGCVEAPELCLKRSLLILNTCLDLQELVPHQGATRVALHTALMPTHAPRHLQAPPPSGSWQGLLRQHHRLLFLAGPCLLVGLLEGLLQRFLR